MEVDAIVNDAHAGGLDVDGEWKHLWVSVNGEWLELSGPSNYFGLMMSVMEMRNLF